MKALMIIGSYPPDVCGVGDATHKVLNTPTGKSWEIYYRCNWGMQRLLRHIKDINATGAKYLLMAFPTRGYGWSLTPHLLCLYYSWFTRKRFGVVLHEQSQLSFKAYIAELLILISANQIIFTNQFERSYAIRRIPFMARRSTVVKIYSNIPGIKPITTLKDRKIDIVYFGQIMPLKGIERFIKEVMPLANRYKVVLIGSSPPQFAVYAEKIVAQCKQFGITTHIGLNAEDVAALLNNCKVAYLPFPDGASERRGSLFAATLNGAVAVTTFGKFTTPALMEACIDIAENSLENILLNEELLIVKQQAGQRFMQTQTPHGWEDVAKQYEQFMKSE
jgi:glycosyltransferase involved in cell wall biosynthesis